MTEYLVTLRHLSNDFYLRSSIWTADYERAQGFDTREAAQAQLDKAKKFMKAQQYKAANIVER